MGGDRKYAPPAIYRRQSNVRHGECGAPMPVALTYLSLHENHADPLAGDDTEENLTRQIRGLEG